MINGPPETNYINDIRIDTDFYQCFSNFLLKQDLPQMFALLKEPCVMTQMSVLQYLINQMGRNIIFILYHEMIKICGFIQGSIGTIENHVNFTRN